MGSSINLQGLETSTSELFKIQRMVVLYSRPFSSLECVKVTASYSYSDSIYVFQYHDAISDFLYFVALLV